MTLPTDESQFYAGISVVLVAIGVVVTDTELLANAFQRGGGGLLDGRFLRLGNRGTTAVVRTVGNPMFTVMMRLVDLVSAVVVVVATAPGVRAAGLGVMLIGEVTLLVGLPYGRDAADHMAVIVLGGLCAYYALYPSSEADVALWFIALNMGVCYLTAGGSKARSRAWRDGSAITLITASRRYGDERLGSRMARYPGLALVCGWSVIILECGASLTPFLPTPVTLPLLVMAALFHVSVTMAMRLHAFVWSFLACYPAALWCGLQIWRR